MFKMMRACLGCDKKEQLWINLKEYLLKLEQEKAEEEEAAEEEDQEME